MPVELRIKFVRLHSFELKQEFAVFCDGSGRGYREPGDLDDEPENISGWLEIWPDLGEKIGAGCGRAGYGFAGGGDSREMLDSKGAGYGYAGYGEAGYWNDYMEWTSDPFIKFKDGFYRFGVKFRDADENEDDGSGVFVEELISSEPRSITKLERSGGSSSAIDLSWNVSPDL